MLKTQNSQPVKSCDNQNMNPNDDSDSSGEDSDSKPTTFGTEDKTQIISKLNKKLIESTKNKINELQEYNTILLSYSQTLDQTAQTLDTALLELTVLNNSLYNHGVKPALINFVNYAQNRPATLASCQQILTVIRDRITSEVHASREQINVLKGKKDL